MKPLTVGDDSVTYLVIEKVNVSSGDSVAAHLRTQAGWVIKWSAVIGYKWYFTTVLGDS